MCDIVLFLQFNLTNEATFVWHNDFKKKTKLIIIRKIKIHLKIYGYLWITYTHTPISRGEKFQFGGF